MNDKRIEKYNNEPKRIWRQGNKPYRSIVFWGWNSDNEPSFLILYGAHQFKEEKSYFIDGSDIERFENVLCDTVDYTSYLIINGKEGHLPSFEAVNIVEDGGYYNRDKQDEFPKMYYKKDSRVYGWSRNLKDEGIVKDYKKFEEGCRITIPYFEETSYSELVEKVKGSGIKFDDFKFVQNPNDILKLPEELKDYYELLCVMFSDKNLYTRKKKLTELMESNPHNEIYKYIFKLGSTELLSGLFLEAAKRNINSFIDEAEYICQNEIHYSEDSYVQGLKRCTEIYLNTVIKEKRQEREKWIRENLSEIDLNLIKIDGKDIPEGKILNGARYRKLATQEALREYIGHYERQPNGRWEYIRNRAEDRYKKGPFNDGVVFDVKLFKNTIQEAEAYNMADVIGKLAYYIDAPRLHYYFKGNGLSRALKYFKRYIRRIIEGYGKNDPEKFMEAVKVLFTSYTEDDFICKFKGNFQFNYFIKNILYYDFKEKPPVGWDYWRERYEWMSKDKLLSLQGRYEYMKEIWDNHLDDVLYILSKSKVSTISKACYFILKESDKFDELIEGMTYEEIVKLTMSKYKPVAQLFMEALENRLNAEESFDFNIMSALMNNDSTKLNQLGMNYFDNTNGYLSDNDIVDLFFFDDLEKWTDYINSNIKSLKTENYDEFVKAMIDADDRFKEAKLKLPDEIKDTLSESVNKVYEMSNEKRSTLIKLIISTILEKKSMADILETYIEEVVFAFSYEDIKEILNGFDFDYKNTVLSVRNERVLNIIDSIINENIPSDSTIIEVLERGTSKMIKTLFEIINANEDELISRYSTMLIFLESDVVFLNNKSKELFNKMDEESRIKMHKIIIDSPVKKAYEFGLKKLDEIYGEFVPSDFIMQMLEHTSSEVKGYITDKSDSILNSLGKGNEELFMYYAKTLLLLPNRIRKNKDDIYDALFNFAAEYSDKRNEVEEFLLEMGGSNIIKDSEKALVTLAKIRKEAAF